jgi:hypothetical protein
MSKPVNDKHWVDVRIPSDKVTDLRNGTLVPSDKLREMQERLARLEAVLAAVKKRGPIDHTWRCATSDTFPKPCNCGVDALDEAIRACDVAKEQASE